MDAPVFDPCRGCPGVCCQTYRVAFHWSETTPLGAVPAPLTKPLRKHEVIMIGTEHQPVRCVALSDQGRCTIHGRHPSVCQEVQPGSDQCQRARAKHGLAAWSAVIEWSQKEPL